MDLGAELAVALGQVVHLVLLSLQVIEGFLEGKIHMSVSSEACRSSRADLVLCHHF